MTEGETNDTGRGNRRVVALDVYQQRTAGLDRAPSRARNERFRDSDIFRRVFEHVVQTCIAAGLVGGEGFAVDASLIVADANKQRSNKPKFKLSRMTRGAVSASSRLLKKLGR